MTTTGPNGEKRPKDPIARAVHVAKIATGEIEETLPEQDTELAQIAAEVDRRETIQAAAGIIEVAEAEGIGLEPQR